MSIKEKYEEYKKLGTEFSEHAYRLHKKYCSIFGEMYFDPHAWDIDEYDNTITVLFYVGDTVEGLTFPLEWFYADRDESIRLMTDEYARQVAITEEAERIAAENKEAEDRAKFEELKKRFGD